MESVIRFILFVILILNSFVVLAEGQSGMKEYYFVLYLITSICYILIAGSLILLIRKVLKKANTKKTKLIAFTIGAIFTFIFYLIDEFYFLPIFWGI